MPVGLLPVTVPVSFGITDGVVTSSLGGQFGGLVAVADGPVVGYDAWALPHCPTATGVSVTDVTDVATV